MSISTFDRDDYAERFTELRSVPPQLMAVYLKALLPRQMTGLNVLDVGAGTGQFTTAIAKSRPDAIVTALEPSPEMFRILQQSVRSAGLANVRINNSPLEALIDSGFDLVVLSEVIHLFQPLALVDRLSNVIAANGRLAIRTSSQEQLRRRDWYRFFPRARLIDMERHPSLLLLSEALRECGFRVFEAIIDESRSIPGSSFRQMLSRRMFSTLDLLSCDEFDLGCSQMESELRGVDVYRYDYEMTLLIAERLE